MPKGDIVIVFDVGATNVRCIAINSKGEILASEAIPNNTTPDPDYPSFRIWDVVGIWNKMCSASGKVVGRIDRTMIIGVTVTAFGVDGTFFDQKGKILYPVISWQCERTAQILKDIEKYVPMAELYYKTGVYPFSFNTIFKLIWFLEHRPDVIEKSAAFLFMPSIFSCMLTGELVNDITMAGTSMLTDIAERKISRTILEKIQFPETKFGTIVEAGTITGKIKSKAAAETGLPVRLPVVATGHDTQFAIFGSGAEKNQPVLSSGTWEVLMARSEKFRSGPDQLKMGITTEFDSRPGLYNIGTQWIASGVIEVARKKLFSDISENVYDYMIAGAEKVGNGAKVPAEFNEIVNGVDSAIDDPDVKANRFEIFRAILEALSQKLAEGKTSLEAAGGFKTDSILCVGGGSKNRLWNQLRADYTGVPVKIIDHKETTVLGASLFVQAACGNALSPEEARSKISYKTEVFTPHPPKWGA